MVDLGITFPEGDDDPGVDVIFPDLRFIEEERARSPGIVITHAHEDHIGAVVDLWKRLRVPVYATPFTAGMLKAKLAEFGNRLQIPIREIPLNGRFDVGPFNVEFFEMSHSIPETQRACHSHAARHGAAHRRLEARSNADHWWHARRRASARRSAMKVCWRRHRRFHQCHARRTLAVRA